MKLLYTSILLLLLGTCPVFCQETGTFSIDFETYSLENGLEVILHQDSSDPVVAVTLTVHVGSAREKKGRTGFAHLFEHLLFLESENLGEGGLDELSARIGGSGANGFTSRDLTNYYQTVPENALEKMIWAEADKLGFFINTVTESVLAKEKQVVKNEKRMSVDNVPYGHTLYVIHKNLYPETHPYHWQVIGSLEDLQNATLQDVKDFYNQWYVPNNVILTIAGNFDKEQAKQWVRKYFGEIERGPDIEKADRQPVTLTESKRLYHEDNFARLPELRMAWPSVHSLHEDVFALEILTAYLASGKNAPLYKKIVEEKKLAGGVDMFNRSSELAGELMLQVRAFEDRDLDAVRAAVGETFGAFAQNGIPPEDLKRIKAGLETEFYDSISSVSGKGFQLAHYGILAGDPGLINKLVDNLRSVTADDVIRVFNKYIKDRHSIATAFVPKGRLDLALEDSVKAEIPEEKIEPDSGGNFDLSKKMPYEKTPSRFDRSVEPPYDGGLETTPPEIWDAELPSGLTVMGITNKEVPVVLFSLEIEGGRLLESPSTAGISYMLAGLLTRGTREKTAAEVEEALQLLGASIFVDAYGEKITLSGNTLARNFSETMALLREILLEPRWDEKELDLIKQQMLSRLQEEKGNPFSIAVNEFKKLVYGGKGIGASNPLGTPETVRRLEIEDLKKYYRDNLSPTVSTLMTAGFVDKQQVVSAAEALTADWEPKKVDFPEIPEYEPLENSKVYFYDVPGAKQSVLAIGALALSAEDGDYYPAVVMNYRLGGGGFASRLTQALREGKGYTYNIQSGFVATSYTGPFIVNSAVRTNVTYEAVELIRDLLENYSSTFTSDDLHATRSFMLKSNAQKFETLDAKLSMLMEINDYGLKVDYLKRREETVRNLEVSDIRRLADKYVDPDRMVYLVVGDAETQLEKLGKLGYGKPILLNPGPEK